MKIRVIEFDGSPDELEKAKYLFQAPLASDKRQEAHEAMAESVELSSEIVERAFTRISLSSNQQKVLRALLKAGKNGLVNSEIAHELGITRQQLAGVMGAFGRRVANTPGWPRDAHLFDYKWDPDEGQWRYWLPEVVRAALTEGKVKLSGIRSFHERTV